MFPKLTSLTMEFFYESIKNLKLKNLTVKFYDMPDKMIKDLVKYG